MKKTLIIVLLMAITFSLAVFADNLVELIDLNALSEIGIENNLEVQSKSLILENKKIDLEKVKDIAKRYDYMSGDRVNFIKNRIKVESDTIVSEMNVWQAEKMIEKTTIDLKNNSYKKGMSYLLLQEEISLNRTLLEHSKIYLSNVERKVEKGLMTQTELLNKRLEIQTAELKLLELQGNLEILKIELNHLTGKDFITEKVLKDEISLMTYMPISVKEFYEDNYETYPDIYEKTVLLKARTIEYDLYASKYLDYNKEYKTSLYNKQLAEISLREAKRSYEVAIKKGNNLYLNAYDAYQLSVKQLAYQEKLYDQTALKYDHGLITKEEIIHAEDAKLNAAFAIQKAIVAYNNTCINFVYLK